MKEPRKFSRSGLIISLSTAFSVIFLDQLTKLLALQFLKPFEPVEVLGNVLRLTLVFNDRAAFSLGGSTTWFFTLTSSLATLALLYFVPRFPTKSWLILGGFALGGVVGNLIDRLTKYPGFPNGHVVDFIQIPFNFPIFNIADMAITITAVIIAIRFIRGERLGGSK
ncbi:MAG: signal peptidase II [Rhodoluna sp.]